MDEAQEAPKKPGRPAKVEVEVIRSIGVDADPKEKDDRGNLKFPDGVRMAQKGEKVKLEREAAIKLQNAGAVRAVI